jgi:hypothetical protein
LGRPRSSSATCASHRRSLTIRPLGDAGSDRAGDAADGGGPDVLP